MLVIFFIGIGASSILTSFANNPLQIGVLLTLVGIFASIYHPVGLAMVATQSNSRGVALAVNGVFGNMGAAAAALITGFLIELSGWRGAFLYPGIFSILIGVAYAFTTFKTSPPSSGKPTETKITEQSIQHKKLIFQIFAIVLFTAALGGFIFQSTTFSLPKVLEKQLPFLEQNMASIGWYSFAIFVNASFAQLVVGYFLDKYPARRIFMQIALSQMLLFICVSFASSDYLFALAILFMLAVFGQVPINDVLVAQLAKSNWRSRAYGLRSVVTFSIMATTLPAAAWIYGIGGFALLFKVLAALALGIFMATLFLPKKKHVLS